MREINLFGYEVKKYLLEKNLKQQVITDKSGASKGAVSQLLNRDNISLDKMIMIADALDCDLEIKLKPRNHNDEK